MMTAILLAVAIGVLLLMVSVSYFYSVKRLSVDSALLVVVPENVNLPLILIHVLTYTLASTFLDGVKQLSIFLACVAAFQLLLLVLLERIRYYDFSTISMYFAVDTSLAMSVHINDTTIKLLLIVLALIVIAYAYVTRDYYAVLSEHKRSDALRKSYRDLRQQYGSIIKNQNSQEAFMCLCLCILLVESTNRPKILRYVENVAALLFPGKRVSTGIMQVRSREPLTDKDSVVAGAAMLDGYWNKTDTKQVNEHRIWHAARTYNHSTSYADFVLHLTRLVKEAT